MLELDPKSSTAWNSEGSSQDKVQPLPAAIAGPSELEMIEGVAAAEAAQAAAPANICGALRRAVGMDDSSQMRVDLARVTAERDAARKERDQLIRLCGDLKQQLLDERKVTTRQRRPSLAHDLTLNREAVELMFEGLEVIASDLYVHEVVGRVVSTTTRVLGCERVTLFLADEERKELTGLASTSDETVVKVAYGQGLIGSCADKREVISVDDAYADARFNKDVDTHGGYRTRAVLCCPLLDAKGALVAVLHAINPLHGGSFTQREIQVCMRPARIATASLPLPSLPSASPLPPPHARQMKGIAHAPCARWLTRPAPVSIKPLSRRPQLLQFMQMPTAIALLNARLHESLRTANDSASALVRVAMVVNAQNTAEQVATGSNGSLVKLMEKVVGEAQSRFDADRCSMYIADHAKGEIWSLVAMGLPDRFTVPIGKGISGKCAQTGELINVRDATSDPRTAHAISQSTGYAMKSTLCIPVIDNRLDGPERIIGVIQLLNKATKPDYFTAHDEASLQAFSKIVALAMRNAMVFDELRQKDLEREMIFSSISSFICRFSVDGKLEWCNSPRLLQEVLGVAESQMREQHFDRWLAKIRTIGPESTAICLPLALGECLQTGKETKARNAELKSAAAEDGAGEPSRFFNFSLTPLMRADVSIDHGEERRVGALLVLEDVSDQFKRKQAEAKLSELEAQIKREQNVLKKAVSETPLQRAIDVVGELRDKNPELREPLQEILTQLSSSNVMLPSLMTDQSKMASMDDFTREFLGQATGVELNLEAGPARRRRLSHGDGNNMPSWKEHAATLDENRRSMAKEDSSLAGAPANSKARTGRRNSLPTRIGGAGAAPLFNPLDLPGAAPAPDSRPTSAEKQRAGDVVMRRASAPDAMDLSKESSVANTPDPIRRSSEECASLVEALLKKMSPSDWRPPPHITDAELYSWDLDLYDPSRPDRAPYGCATPNELMAICHSLFESVEVRKVLGVSVDAVQSFIIACHDGYLDMPFHNFSHGTYVLHGSVLCLKRCPLLQTLLEPTDKVALAIAALGHDIGHMGVQNTFLINSNDPLALQYNDRSVLENMHCSRLFSVLRQRGSQLLDGLTTEQYKAIRKSMIGMIMATDVRTRPERGQSTRARCTARKGALAHPFPTLLSQRTRDPPHARPLPRSSPSIFRT